MAVESAAAGLSARILAPQLAILPLRSYMSLCASGTPASGPVALPLAMAASAALAAARASSASSAMMQLVSSWQACSRSMAALVASTLDTCLSRMAFARPRAERAARSVMAWPLA